MTAQTYKENISGTSIGNDTLSGNGGSITSGATAFIVATTPSDTAGTNGLPATPPYDIAIGTERMRVTGVVAGTKTLTVTRHTRGTTATAHNDGDVVDLLLTAGGLGEELALLAPLASPTFTGIPVSPLWSASGLPGATAGLRIVGSNTVGPPTAGTFIVGDVAFDQAGDAYVCTSAGTPGTWKRVPLAHFARTRKATAQSLNNVTYTTITYPVTDEDTDHFHFTSAANLTGTVAKAAGSPNIVGTSTLFTSELSVNQVITIPGTTTEIGVVKSITDDTHLTLWANMANTATGQTAARSNAQLAIPAGLAGTYLIWRVNVYTGNSTGNRGGQFVSNNAHVDTTGNAQMLPAANVANGQSVEFGFIVGSLSDGDYVYVQGFQSSGGSLNISSGNGNVCAFGLVRLGG